MARDYSMRKYVPILSSADIVSGITCESINVSKCTHVTFIVVFGPSLSGNAVLTIYEAASDAGTTAAITFEYTYGGAATASALSDVMSTPSTSAALTCTGTTFVSRILLCEFDMENMTDGYNWITPVFGSEASAGECTIIAECHYKYGTPEEATLLS